MTAPSRLRQDKLAVRFDQHDVDGDGYIEEDDYQKLGSLLSDSLNADAAQRQAISAGLAEQWTQLHTLADTDRDGRISREEYITAMGSGIAADLEALDRAVLQSSRAIVTAADSDDDGYLDLPDYERLAALLRIEQAADGFALLDTDADGRLSIQEILTALVDFYTSDDPDSPGNLLFGRAA